MSDDSHLRPAAVPELPAMAAGRRTRAKVLVLVTEDWFAVSHFLPLLAELVAAGLEVAVATRVVAHADPIAAIGARIVPFDFVRGRMRPGADLATLGRLRRLLAAERPDIVHAIALKPLALGGFAYLASPARRLVLHLTGRGLTGTDRQVGAGVMSHALERWVGLLARRRDAWLLVENEDDAREIGRPAESPRVTVLGGAGVDGEALQPLPMPPLPPLRLGFVGRMIWSKGVDVLVAAHERLRARGLAIETHLYGAPDAENPRAIAEATLKSWSERPGLAWHGRTGDIAGVWRRCHVAVVPSRGGEGLPRSLLEAAAMARPLVVTDVPGCRRFVRPEIEGLVVPPDDPEALATAIARLPGDPARLERLGHAARARVLEGFTEAHVRAAYRRVYERLLGELDR